MLIFILIFALIRALQGAPTPSTEVPVFEIDTNIICRRSLAFGTRGVSEIVFSCLATIFACTWTSIHPNIPGPTDSGWTKFKRRVVTTVYALLAPEVIVFWAMQQRIMAKRIVDMYNKEFVKLTSKSHSFPQRCLHSVREWFNDPPLHPPLEENEVRQWTITHGFFIQMGGFVLSQKGVPIQVLPYSRETVGGKQRVEGLEYLIRTGTVNAPTTTEEDIKDRSKGDTISKTVVILQTTWFIAQCIVRWSKMLPVTELEIVTLGFALLNGITYALWWDKPQSVGVPVYLEKRGLKEGEGRQDVEREGAITSQPLGDESGDMGHGEADTVPPAASNRRVPPKRSYLPRKLAKDRENHPSFLFWILDVPYRLIQTLLRPLSKMGDDDVIYKGDLRVPMFYAADARESDDLIILSVSSLIGVLFGSVHLIPSWFLRFPSLTEMWLWRVSAVIITVEPVLTAIFPLADLLDLDIPDLLGIIIFIPLVLGFPLYIFARCILIILAFTSLHALPSAAFSTIDWVSSIPHF